MVQVDRWYASRRRSTAQVSSALLCLAALSGCASAATATTTRPAGSGSPAASSTPGFGPYDKPLLSCTSAQQSAATGSVHVLSVISSQTVHVTVGERIDLAETWAPINPDGTGLGQVSLWAGQHVVCQNGDVTGRFTGIGGKPGQRLPLVITQAGQAKLEIIAGYTGSSPSHGVIYIDATAGKASS